MSFKVDDKEWRETVRGFFFHLWGESLKDIPEDEEGTFHDGDGVEHPFHGKAELIEVMFNNTFKNGFADALKLFYEEHGFYPALPDLSKMPRSAPYLTETTSREEITTQPTWFVQPRFEPKNMTLGGLVASRVPYRMMLSAKRKRSFTHYVNSEQRTKEPVVPPRAKCARVSAWDWSHFLGSAPDEHLGCVVWRLRTGNDLWPSERKIP